MQFAIKLRPHHHESKIGYILRLAHENGYLSLGRMLKATAIQAIVKASEVKDELLSALLPTTPLVHFGDVATPLFKKQIALHPKVCLSCINEAQYIGVECLNPLNIACPHHQTPLIDSCLYCGVLLKWDINLIKGLCTNPSCQKKLTSDKRDYPLDLEPKQVADCLLAGLVRENPTLGFISQTKFIGLSHQHKLIAKGYKLLNDQNHAVKWLKQSINYIHKIYPMSFATVTIKTLIKNLQSNDWRALDAFQQHMQSATRTNKVNDFNLITTANVMMDLLGVKLFELRRLQELNLVIVSGAKRLTGQSILNTAPLFERLSKLSDIEGKIALSEQTNTLTYYDISSLALIEALCDGTLEAGFMASDNFLSSIYVSPTTLNGFTKQQFEKRMGNKITLEQAKAMTGLRENQLVALQNENKLQAINFNQNGVRYFCLFEDIVKLRAKSQGEQLSLTL